MTARVYSVTAAGRDAGTLHLDMGRLVHQRWLWRSASGAIEEWFATKTAARDHLSWLCRCRPGDVILVEQQEQAA